MSAPRPEALCPADAPRVEAFLRRHADRSMFLRSNLLRAGLVDGGERFQGTWRGLSVDGELVAVGAVFWNGVLLLQAPRFPGVLARQLALASPRPLRGVIGPWLTVIAARAALDLQDVPCATESREDLFSLGLSSLRVPEGLRSADWAVRAATEGDLELLTRWGADSDVEVMGARPGEALEAENRATAAAFVAAGEQFVLEVGHRPVATCTWNARLPDSVQVGGVFTPPALRGRGYARSVVAGALLIARGAGAERAILFTGVDNRAAQRAYLAIGFERVGDFGIVLFEEGQAVGPDGAMSSP